MMNSELPQFFSPLTASQILDIALRDASASITHKETKLNGIIVTVTFPAALPNGNIATRTTNVAVSTHSDHYYEILSRVFS